MSGALVCWKCGVSLKEIPRPFARLAECGQCRAELHVCRMCEFYNPRVSEKCDEPMAEHPRKLERANFCDYFKPKRGAFVARNEAKAGAAKAGLDALFGEAPKKGVSSDTNPARAKLAELFGSESKKKDPPR